MHSPDKRNPLVSSTRDPRTDVRRSLKALLEPQTIGTSSTQWTFTDVHLGSRSARAHAKLSCLLAIHDVQWEGFINGNQQVPEEWKLFPGPLWDQFRERLFGSTSTTKDALEWIKAEYRQDQQERLTDHRLRPNIEDAFWNKDFFDALRSGNWSSSHSMQQNDVDDQFSVFAFILSVDKSATWPPRIPLDGIAIADMVQLGRNLMWFMDLALAQPGQPGSLFLDFSLLGEAIDHQFELLDHRGLAQQWDATTDSRCRHSYAFLSCLHRLFAEMHRWFSSVPLVFHVSPAGSPLNHVMALSPLIANRRGGQGSIWKQRADWLRIVDGLFRDSFDSSQTLRNQPPSWIMRSPPRPGGSSIQPHAAPAARGGRLGRHNQGEPLPPSGARSLRDRPVSSTPTPAPAQATPDDGVTVVTTAHPLFALSPNLPAADRVSAPGQILYKLSKSLSVDIPKYGEGDSTKRICFNFTTDGWCKCLGMVQAGKRKKCYRLHLSLEPNSPQRSDPSTYFKDVVRFLQAPGVADYFIPSDEFATSQQYRDALASL
jgi:hypothetical protein